MKKTKETPHICKVIDRCLQDGGITPKQLAMEMDVSEATVSRWRSSIVPSSWRWQKIADTLGVHMAEFFGQGRGAAHPQGVQTSTTCSMIPCVGSLSLFPGKEDLAREYNVDVVANEEQEPYISEDDMDLGRQNEKLQQKIETLEQRIYEMQLKQEKTLGKISSLETMVLMHQNESLKLSMKIQKMEMEMDYRMKLSEKDQSLR